MANQSENKARDYQAIKTIVEMNVKKGDTIYEGQFVAEEDGYATAATSGFSGGIVGVAIHEADSSDSGDETVKIVADGIVGWYNLCTGLTVNDSAFLFETIYAIDSENLGASSITTTAEAGKVIETDSTNSLVRIQLTTVLT